MVQKTVSNCFSCSRQIEFGSQCMGHILQIRLAVMSTKSVAILLHAKQRKRKEKKKRDEKNDVNKRELHERKFADGF